MTTGSRQDLKSYPRLHTEYEDSDTPPLPQHREQRTPGAPLRDRYHDSNQTAITAGGVHPLPNSWLLSYRVSYSKARLDTPYRLESTFRQTGVTFSPNVTASSIDPSNIQANPANENLNSYLFIQNAIQNDNGQSRNGRSISQRLHAWVALPGRCSSSA